MKKMTAFRLSPEVGDLLKATAERTGLDKTAVLEWCLLKAAHQIPDGVRLGRLQVAEALNSSPAPADSEIRLEDRAGKSGAAARAAGKLPARPLSSIAAWPSGSTPAPKPAAPADSGLPQSTPASVPTARARRKLA
jgi:hypothetical protein